MAAVALATRTIRGRGGLIIGSCLPEGLSGGLPYGNCAGGFR
jgi:hypothetical protein